MAGSEKICIQCRKLLPKEDFQDWRFHTNLPRKRICFECMIEVGNSNKLDKETIKNSMAKKRICLRCIGGASFQSEENFRKFCTVCFDREIYSCKDCTLNGEKTLPSNITINKEML